MADKNWKYLDETEAREIEEYIGYAGEVADMVHAAGWTDKAFDIVFQATLSPKFYWAQTRKAEEMGDQIEVAADKIIKLLQTRKLSRPAYNLLSRAVFRVTNGKNLMGLDYAAGDFKQLVVKALKVVDSSGLVYTNLLKLEEGL